MPLGTLLGLWGSFGDHLGAFGWPMAVFFKASARKRKIVKSVVLLQENISFRGGGELVGVILRFF